MAKNLQGSAQMSDLATLLIPVSNKSIVLPNVTVAEIISYAAPVKVETSPDWFLGDFSWRNLNVPLVSFELLNNESFDVPNKDRRIAILNGISGDLKLPFFGIVVQGVPRLIRVMPDEIAVDESLEAGPAEIAVVSVTGERASIPSVEFIEQQVLSIL